MENKNGYAICDECGGTVDLRRVDHDSWWVNGTIPIYAKCADCGKMWEKIVELDDFDEYEEGKDEREI